jgi:hypothetical protein
MGRRQGATVLPFLPPLPKNPTNQESLQLIRVCLVTNRGPVLVPFDNGTSIWRNVESNDNNSGVRSY